LSPRGEHVGTGHAVPPVVSVFDAGTDGPVTPTASVDRQTTS